MLSETTGLADNDQSVVRRQPSFIKRFVTERAKLYLNARSIVTARVTNRRGSSQSALRLIVASYLCVSACNTPPPSPNGGNPRVQPSYDTDGKLQKIAYDRSGDGKPDSWGYMDGARVARVEVDENGDGTVDRWEYYEADAEPAGQTADPRALVRIERATKFDGTVSRREFFTHGRLARTEEDTDGNGRLDKWETYTDGALSLLSLDTSGRGFADRRLVYGANGTLLRIEADTDGSGIFKTLNP